LVAIFGQHGGASFTLAAMKVTLKYEESDKKELDLTLRLTLPQKYVNGLCRGVVKLFVDHYNKKHPEDQLDVEALHLKIVGGDHLHNEERVCDHLSGGDELYLLPDCQKGESRAEAKAAAEAKASKAAAEAAAAASAVPSSPSASSSTGNSARAPKKDENGRVRCKNFGCQRHFDPEGEPQPCTHHKAPPTFHETAKWWSCCPDRKAYEFDEFMRIPGCVTTYCTAVPAGQGNKKFLGGADLRGDAAPVRLDANAPVDPRRKLDALRKGFLAIGGDGELFEKVWGQLAAETGDLDKVVEQFRMRFKAVLNNKDL